MRRLRKAETTKKLLRKLTLGVAWHESCILHRSTSSTYSSDFTWKTLVNYPRHTWSLVTSQFIYAGCRYLTLNLLTFLVAPSLKLIFLSILLPRKPNPRRSKFRGTN